MKSFRPIDRSLPIWLALAVSLALGTLSIAFAFMDFQRPDNCNVPFNEYSLPVCKTNRCSELLFVASSLGCGPLVVPQQIQNLQQVFFCDFCVFDFLGRVQKAF